MCIYSYVSFSKMKTHNNIGINCVYLDFWWCYMKAYIDFKIEL